MLLIILLVVAGVGAFAYWKQQQKRGPSLIATVNEKFHARGVQARPADLRLLMDKIDRDLLMRSKGLITFYPNEKMIHVYCPPQVDAYCHCELIQYLDLTRLAENKYIYGVSKSQTQPSSESN